MEYNDRMAESDNKHSDFFTNRACEYFPCHDGIAPDEFNCLFCYCPLYCLGPDCGGNYTYTEKGMKSCIDCAVMHEGRQGAQRVADRFKELSDLASKPEL